MGKSWPKFTYEGIFGTVVTRGIQICSVQSQPTRFAAEPPWDRRQRLGFWGLLLSLRPTSHSFHSVDVSRYLRRGQRPRGCKASSPRTRRRPRSDAATFYRGCFRISRSAALRALATAFRLRSRCVPMLETRSAAPVLPTALPEDSAPPPLRRCHLLPRMLSDLQVRCAARTCHRVPLMV